MYLLYSILFSVGITLAAPFYWWRKGRAQTRGHWAERFGNIPFREPRPGAIWIHAVSLGETLAVAGLVKDIQRTFPQRPIYLSHVTPAGREAGEKRLPDIRGRFYAPLDWRWSVRKAMERIRPALLLIVETELWPNLFRCAQEAGAHVLLVNARLSRQSLRGYRWVRPFMRRVLADVDRVCAQTEDDAQRFRQIGACADRVKVMGNLKFDAQPPQIGGLARALKAAIQNLQSTPVFVAASTMPGEEPQVLEAWDRFQGRHPRALLILAPRHPARFEQVSQELARQQRRFVRRTTLALQESSLQAAIAANNVLLLDTIGELAGVFEVADIVFMGGSLVATGGHNLLEPAYWSKAIVFGPHMENFRDIARLFLEAGAAMQVSDAEELARTADLMMNPETRERLGARARQVLEQHSGATARTLAEVRKLLTV